MHSNNSSQQHHWVFCIKSVLPNNTTWDETIQVDNTVIATERFAYVGNTRSGYLTWLLMKKFYSKNYFTIECSLSMYSPSLSTRWPICFFHWSTQCWKFSFVRALRSFADFHFTSSIDSNLVPFKADLIFGKRKVTGY